MVRFSLPLIASVVLAIAQAACVDHDPVVKAIATKMGFSQFGSCAAMESFCNTEISLPEMSISAVMDIPEYDKHAINILTVGAEQLQTIGKFTLPSLLALTCPVTCGACSEIDHISLYKQNREKLINALEGIEDLILNGKQYHSCNTGSHGCDKSYGGICYKDGEEDSNGWRCGCEPGFVCTEGCEAPFANHACERKDSAPLLSPTNTQVACIMFGLGAGDFNMGEVCEEVGVGKCVALPGIGSGKKPYSGMTCDEALATHAKERQEDDGFLAKIPTKATPACEDHDAVVGAVASAFGVSDCASVKGFCSNAMPIPAAMIPDADDPRRAAIPASLQTELDNLLQMPQGALKLSTVLAISCPVTCQSGCGSPKIEASSSGECANSKDGTIWSTTGKASMEKDMTRCTMRCLANVDGTKCISSCMQQEIGYSAGCGDCFGTLGGCINDNCLMDCMGNDKQACDKCASSKCSPAFGKCSGIEEGEKSGAYRSLRGDPRRV